MPSRAEVTVVAPRADGALVTQVCSASSTTPTPRGAEIGVEALGDLHSQPLLWVWGRAAKHSASRARSGQPEDALPWQVAHVRDPEKSNM